METPNTLMSGCQGLNIDLTEDEFDAGTFHTFQWPESGLYFTGLEVFHSLHCLVCFTCISVSFISLFGNPFFFWVCD